VVLEEEGVVGEFAGRWWVGFVEWRVRRAFVHRDA
jgi:hypothetical protein